jgi:hypothetical protein
MVEIPAYLFPLSRKLRVLRDWRRRVGKTYKAERAHLNGTLIASGHGGKDSAGSRSGSA